MTPTVGRFRAWLLCSRKYPNRRIAVHLDTAGTASCSRPFANASGDVPAITRGSNVSGLANNVHSASPPMNVPISRRYPSCSSRLDAAISSSCSACQLVITRQLLPDTFPYLPTPTRRTFPEYLGGQVRRGGRSPPPARGRAAPAPPCVTSWPGGRSQAAATPVGGGD